MSRTSWGAEAAWLRSQTPAETVTGPAGPIAAPRDRLARPVHGLPGLHRAGLGHQPGDLLAADAREHVGVARDLRHLGRDRHQHAVAGAVAVLLVDPAEAVDVHQREREAPSVAPGPRHLLRQALVEGPVVGQAGQRIGGRARPGLGEAAPRRRVEPGVGQRHRGHPGQALRRGPLAGAEAARAAEGQEERSEQDRLPVAEDRRMLEAQADQRAGAEGAGRGGRDGGLARDVLHDQGGVRPARQEAPDRQTLGGEVDGALDHRPAARVPLGGVDLQDARPVLAVHVAGRPVRPERAARGRDDQVDGAGRVELAPEGPGHGLADDALAVGGRLVGPGVGVGGHAPKTCLFTMLPQCDKAPPKVQIGRPQVQSRGAAGSMPARRTSRSAIRRVASSIISPSRSAAPLPRASGVGVGRQHPPRALELLRRHAEHLVERGDLVRVDAPLAVVAERPGAGRRRAQPLGVADRRVGAVHGLEVRRPRGDQDPRQDAVPAVARIAGQRRADGRLGHAQRRREVARAHHQRLEAARAGTPRSPRR